MENVVLNNSVPFDNSKRIMAIIALILIPIGYFTAISVLVSFVMASAAMVLLSKDNLMLKSFGKNYSSLAVNNHNTSKIIVILAFIFAIIGFFVVLYLYQEFGTISYKEIDLQLKAKEIKRL